VLGKIEATVERIESQDELYQKIADEYGAALARVAHAYEADPDLRRDLLQEIHLELWRSLEKFGGRCSVRTWVYRVAHNAATSHVVRQARGKRNAPAFLSLEQAEPLASNENVETCADRRHALDRLFTLIRQLEPPDRQVILAYLEDLDAESIAEITGLSVTNVWTKIHRIKDVLVRQFHQGGHHGL
jgi:RNA polymerase sigma-70 factor, ECF subfamily